MSPDFYSTHSLQAESLYGEQHTKKRRELARRLIQAVMETRLQIVLCNLIRGVSMMLSLSLLSLRFQVASCMQLVSFERGKFHISHDASRLFSVFSLRRKERSRGFRGRFSTIFFWFYHRPSLLRSCSDRSHAMLPASTETITGVPSSRYKCGM